MLWCSGGISSLIAPSLPGNLDQKKILKTPRSLRNQLGIVFIRRLPQSNKWQKQLQSAHTICITATATAIATTATTATAATTAAIANRNNNKSASTANRARLPHYP